LNFEKQKQKQKQDQKPVAVMSAAITENQKQDPNN